MVTAAKPNGTAKILPVNRGGSHRYFQMRPDYCLPTGSHLLDDSVISDRYSKQLAVVGQMR